jgi:hypothetical protein
MRQILMNRLIGICMCVGVYTEDDRLVTCSFLRANHHNRGLDATRIRSSSRVAPHDSRTRPRGCTDKCLTSARRCRFLTDHPDTSTSMGNLALVLDNQGKYDEAEGIHRRVRPSYHCGVIEALLVNA